MKWLEKWLDKSQFAEDRERRKRVREILEKEITPEQRLMVMKSRPPNYIMDFIRMVAVGFIALSFFVTLANHSMLVTHLENHLGENIYENVVEDSGGSREIGAIGVYSFVGFFFVGAIMLSVGVFYFEARRDKRIRELELEILARHDKEANQ